LTAHVLARISAGNHAAAEDLLGLADGIRGFGPVKHAAVGNYESKLAAARAVFDRPLRSAA